MSYFKLRESYKVTIFILIMLFFIVTPYVLNFSNNAISKNPQDWGAFGSYLGGLLSPFLAIGSLYYVVKTFKQQSFENTFNLLLEQHNDIAHKITSKTDLKASSVDVTLNKLGNEWLENEKSSASADINESPQINSYLRVAYQVLKFVDESCPDDRRKYSRIFRSFLSNELVFLLALNSAQKAGSGEFKFSKYKSLIEEYGILEHLYFSCHNTSVSKFKKSNNFLILKRFRDAAFGDGINYTNFIAPAIKAYICSGKLLLGLLQKKLEKHDEINKVFESYGGFISSMRKSYEKGLSFSLEQERYNLILSKVIYERVDIKVGEIISKNQMNLVVILNKKLKDKLSQSEGEIKEEYKELNKIVDGLDLIFTTCKNKTSPEEYQDYNRLKSETSGEKARLIKMGIDITNKK